jgi:arylsulfatase A-like enzyme
MQRPDVLLIVLDTARADAFEPYGAPTGSSPAVADLARRGRALERVHAAASWTLPSHASMFTGLLPRATGIMGDPERSPLAAKPVIEANADRLLPAVLGAAGYETRAVSANLWVDRSSGFATGFDDFRSVDTGRQAGLHRESLRSRAAWIRESLRARADDGAAEAGAVVRDWFSGPRERPLFGFVNLIECHSPYLPPRPWNDLGPVARMRAASEARQYLTMGAVWKACAGAFDVPDDALERMRHLYARSVRLMDDWLADVLQAIDAASRLDDTLVLVTSDHGENFGEGGLMAHAFSLDQRLLHVPLVAAGPGAPADPGVASLTDVPRWIAAATELEHHPWGEPAMPAGVAVAQFEPPATANDPRWQEAFHEWGVDPAAAAERVAVSLAAATDGHLKLERRGARELLYDLEADPLELAPRDPGSADPAAIAQLRAALDAQAAEPATGSRPVDGPTPEISDAEREQIEERMKLLGYM